MCGIAGIIANKGAEALRPLASAMRESLHHRGPDDSGQYVEPGVALIHTRLSILDLSSHGAQPMTSDDGRYVMVYNGEVYNFPELRAELQALGVSFRSTGDSEVVLQALVQWGAEALHRFNGMFALALWDARERVLMLARDRFGIKPLYVASVNGTTLFGSEPKALYSTGMISKELSDQGLVEYLYYGNTLGRTTLLSQCERVTPGTYQLIDCDGSVTEAPFWSLTHITLTDVPEREAVANISDLLEKAVSRHLIADVPVALFLSGGLDSSTLCALAAEQYGKQLRTISVAFDSQKAHSELSLARQVAARYNTDHQEVRVSFADLKDSLETLNNAHDLPFADAANVPLYLLTRDHVGDRKVVLQGDGGDEIFGGYRRYGLLRHARYWELLARLAIPDEMSRRSHLLRRIRRMQQGLGCSDPGTRFGRLLTEEVGNADLDQLLNADAFLQLKDADPFLRYRELAEMTKAVDPAQGMMWIDSQILLPDIFNEKVDRATMANGVEIRVPMLDTDLTDYVMALPSRLKLRGDSKSLLRQAMNDRLPSSVIQGKKYGFGVPYGDWLQGPLAEFTRSRLLDSTGLMRDRFHRNALERLCNDSENGSAQRSFMLYKLLILAIWDDGVSLN